MFGITQHAHNREENEEPQGKELVMALYLDG